VTLLRGPGIVEVARQQRFEDLGVVRLAERGEADEAAEECGDDPALGTHTADAERRGALGEEPGPVGIRLAAGRTQTHRASLATTLAA